MSGPFFFFVSIVIRMNSCRQVSSVLRSAEVLTRNYTYMLYSATQLSTGWRHVFTFNIDNSELQPSGLFSSLKKHLKRIYSRPLSFLIFFDLRTPSTLIAAREKERLGFNSRHSSTMFVYGIFKQKNGNREREILLTSKPGNTINKHTKIYTLQMYTYKGVY